MTSRALCPVETDGPVYSVMVARLKEAGLLTDDLEDGNARYFSNDDKSAFGGLVVSGDVGLLRSLVVAPEKRKTGTGRALLIGLVAQARVLGVRDLWLLTETAEGFFAHCGFTKAERSAAPGPIAATRQFHDLCPSTATLMRMRIS